MIAVVGGGFSGLATAYYLLEMGANVTLLDKRPIGTGTSSVAAGLVHSYPGFAIKKSLYADEALEETRYLMGKAGIKINEGIYRVAMNDEQEAKLAKIGTLVNQPYVENGRKVFHIANGFSVDCKAYVEALYQLCTSMGMSFIQKEVSELGGFDHVVYACGYESNATVALSNVEKLKGQILEIESDQKMECTIGKGYIAKVENHYHIGSTYERNFTSIEPDENGEQTILNNAKLYLKGADHFKVVASRAGVRLCRKGEYLPIVKEVKKGVWVITAMGSRGLLYHAYYGKKLAKEIFDA